MTNAAAWPGDAEGRLNERYRLLEPVGQGGMSVVWRAHDDVLDRRVAVKVLADSGDERFRRRLRSEARACGRLNARGIAHVYDYGEARSESGAVLPFVVMEFVDGIPLSELLAGGRSLPGPAVAGVGAQIADALSVAHAQGLVHRDIKPGNVMVTRAGIKLIDFGISTWVGDVEAEDDGSLVGTVAYLAPERILGVSVSPAADVYALGVLLYRAATGHMPWPGGTTTEVLAAHLYVDPTPLPEWAGIEPPLARLWASCLDKDPTRRPSSADLARQLAALSGDSPLLPMPALAPTPGDLNPAAPTPAAPSPASDHTRPYSTALPPPMEAARPSLRRRGLIGAGLAGLAALLVLATAWTNLDRTGNQVAVVQPAPACRAAFAVSQDWGTGFTAVLVVTNDSLRPVSAWQVAFAFDGDQTIGSPQGLHTSATATPNSGAPYVVLVGQSGRTVVAGGPAEPHVLAAHQSIQLPIAARYTGANPIPTVFSLNGTRCSATVIGAANTPQPTTAAPKVVPSVATQLAANTSPNADKPEPPPKPGHGKPKKQPKD